METKQHLLPKGGRWGPGSENVWGCDPRRDRRLLVCETAFEALVDVDPEALPERMPKIIA